MLGCVLRCHGDDLDVDAYLSRSPFEARMVWRRGTPWRPGAKALARSSGFAIEVSSAEDRARQCVDALRFVDAFRDELRALHDWPGVERVWLDFAVLSRLGGDVVGHAETFPGPLLAAMGAIPLDLELTVLDTPEVGALDLLRALAKKQEPETGHDEAEKET